MTRKDYIKIVEVLRIALKHGCQCNSDLVSEFSDMLEKNNPRFDRKKFFKAVFK